MLFTQVHQSVNKNLLLEPPREVALHPDMCVGRIQRVLVAEKIDYQRCIAAAPRRCCERAAGNGGDEDVSRFIR